MLPVNVAVTVKVVKRFSGFPLALLSSHFLLAQTLLPVLRPQLLIAVLMLSTGVVASPGKLLGTGEVKHLQDHFLFVLTLPHRGIEVLLPVEF